MNVYTVLAHLLRERILKILDDEHLITYNALLSKLELEETGVLNSRLKKLSNFVERGRGSYHLTTTGQDAIRLMVTNNKIMSGKSIDIKKVLKN
jgi:hypothetical protein